MAPNACPHCGSNPAVSFWRKSCLGPAVTTKCRACKKKVSVSWASLLVVIPIVAGIACAPTLATKIGVGSVVVAVGCYLQWQFVSLVRK
jgi:RNA polymerase subunit RPABC4/transcription elongation factor Spt4